MPRLRFGERIILVDVPHQASRRDAGKDPFPKVWLRKSASKAGCAGLRDARILCFDAPLLDAGASLPV